MEGQDAFYCQKTLENGIPPIVIPQDQRDSYMGMLADCDIDKMADFFAHLANQERERMNSFQVGVTEHKFVRTSR